MEELKLLVEMVSNLPSMALWVLAGFWAYKVICIGSLYGVIRLLINKTHAWLTTPKEKINIVTDKYNSLSITHDGTHDKLYAQVQRICGKRTGEYSASRSAYIHSSSVEWLKEAIDEKEANEAKVKESK